MPLHWRERARHAIDMRALLRAIFILRAMPMPRCRCAHAHSRQRRATPRAAPRFDGHYCRRFDATFLHYFAMLPF